MATQSQQSSSGSYDGWIGRNAYDQSGDKIGEITDIFYDDRTQRPEWVAIKTGMFGAKQTFAPIQGASLKGDGKGDDGGLQLAYDKDQIKDAPRIDPDDEHLSPQEEADVWAYYGYDYQADTTARNTDYGYGQDYLKGQRPDVDYAHRRWNQQTLNWSDERRRDEHTDEISEEVPVSTTATVEVPVEANVRLRRYQTTQQKTRTVEVPYTETTDHTEVAGVDAHAAGGPRVSGEATVGRNQPR